MSLSAFYFCICDGPCILLQFQIPILMSFVAISFGLFRLLEILPLWGLINPLIPNIHKQILQTDPYTFPYRISREKLIKDQRFFSLRSFD